MRRSAISIVALVGAGACGGCNRQDAEALARISQLLADRASAVPIVSPQGQPARGLPMLLGSPPAEVPKGPKDERHGG